MKQFFASYFPDLLNLTYYLAKNLLGTIRHPYLTWRRLAREPHIFPSITLLLIIVLIFNLRAPIRYGLPDRPLNIVIATSYNTFTSLTGYLLTVSLIYFICRIFKPVSFKSIFSIWIFSYLPTVIWFLLTQASYLLLPPPRTTQITGILFTAVYLSLSISLLSWKILLLWLTNQIVCELTPSQNFKATLFLLLSLFNLSFLFYKLHLWGIPYL